MLYADSIFTNGNVVTMTAGQPRAQAIAIWRGKVVAVGANDEILSFANENTTITNLQGKTVVPGFTDSHVHGASLGRALSQINLRHVKSIKEIQRRVRQKAEETSDKSWIRGRGWDQERLEERRLPSRHDLDSVAPDRPVFLMRVCGHLGVANSEALKRAGIKASTRPPRGGRLDRDPVTHELSGVLRENALNLIYDALPEPSQKDLVDTCQRACRRMVEEGITSAHWIISSSNELRALRQLADESSLPIRISAMIPVEMLDSLVALGLTTGFGGERIRIGSVKILTDGSLGARTAALENPYSDAPQTRGMLLYPQRELERLVQKAHRAGLQLAIHAIGDRTVGIVLGALEKALEGAPKQNHRHRIEHASVLNPNLLQRMKKIGVVASVQPHFIVSDFWITSRLGKSRARWTYALGSLLKQGIKTVAGSDAPVEPVSPILGIYAAVARKWPKEEQLSGAEALRCYTVDAAYGSFEENDKGSIERDKLADLTVLSADPTSVAPEQVKRIEVEMTIVGGKTVYARNSSSLT